MTRLLDMLGEAVTELLMAAVGAHLADEAWRDYLGRLGCAGWLCMHCGATTFNTSWECDSCAAARGQGYTTNRLEFDLSDVTVTEDAPPAVRVWN